MCRWLAYSGSPLRLGKIISEPKYSLIDQSMHSKLGVETTNGDGFGVGWYDGSDTPGVFHGVGPAWSDRNFQELSEHVESGLFIAHIRASTGTAVQQTNCHPFRYGRWLWAHNGMIQGFDRIKRELLDKVDATYFNSIEGSTDSELMFHLALTFGLEDDPPSAVARMVGAVEEAGRSRGVDDPIQMTVGTSDGERVWAFRYSSEGRSRSLFFSTDVRTLRTMYKDDPRFQSLSDETRLVVSEPLGDLPGAWNEVPESSYGVIQEGADEIHPFRPETAGVVRAGRAT